MEKIENKFIASTIVNGNEVRLVTRGSRYFIHWGEVDKMKAVQEILTPSGRIPSEKSAYKKFLEAVKVTQYLKFSRL
jgi:hypothetical protein